MEEPRISVRQFFKVRAVDKTVARRISSRQSLQQCIDRRLQVDDEVRNRRLDGEVLGNLVVEFQFVRIEVQLREQAISREQIIGYADVGKQVRLP